MPMEDLSPRAALAGWSGPEAARSAGTAPEPPAPKSTEFDLAIFEPLVGRPTDDLRGMFKGIPYAAHIAIPGYGEKIARYYAPAAPGGLAVASAQAGIPFDLPQFGLIVDFERPARVAVHDAAMVLDDSIRALVACFGAVVLRNACIVESVRHTFHRNLFPHLDFHLDRGPEMANQYSCFTRDPDDEIQRHPRDSATLFIANIVAWLESVRTGACDPRQDRGLRPSYTLFTGGRAASLLGEIILAQPWDAPEGTGEIAVIDNRTVFHATYHKDGKTKGYPIGARYLI